MQGTLKFDALVTECDLRVAKRIASANNFPGEMHLVFRSNSQIVGQSRTIYIYIYNYSEASSPLFCILINE